MTEHYLNIQTASEVTAHDQDRVSVMAPVHQEMLYGNYLF